MKKRIETDAPGAGLQKPFANLAERLGIQIPAAPPREGPRDPAPRTAGPPPSAPGRAVIRLERKGRGGKVATVVEKLDLDPASRESWLAELKRALGCGGAVEGDALVLQGDVRGRVRPLLERRGVGKITLG